MSIEPTFTECFNRWGFKGNPFKETYRDDFWARPDNDIKFIKTLLSNTIEDKDVLNILINGEYGSGKTYALKFLKGYVDHDLNGFGIYFQIPKKFRIQGFRDILAEFIRAIGITTLEEMGKKIADEKGFNKKSELVDYLDSLSLDGDVAKAISNLTYGEDYALTSTWLFGNSTIHQDRALGMRFSTKDETPIVKVITSILLFLNSEYPIVAIFIDEFENLAGESQGIKSIKEGFRNLYDALIDDDRRGPIALITAVTARLEFDIAASTGTAFLDRIGYGFSLRPLDEDHCKKYIQQLFSDCRMNKSDAIIPPFANVSAFNLFIKTFPVTTAVPRTSSSPVKTPRRIMKTGKILLTRACSENKTEIDSDYIIETLGKVG